MSVETVKKFDKNCGLSSMHFRQNLKNVILAKNDSVQNHTQVEQNGANFCFIAPSNLE